MIDSAPPRITAKCPHCHTERDVAATLAGKEVICKSCGKRIVAEPVALAPLTARPPQDPNEYRELSVAASVVSALGYLVIISAIGSMAFGIWMTRQRGEEVARLGAWTMFLSIDVLAIGAALLLFSWIGRAVRDIAIAARAR